MTAATRYPVERRASRTLKGPRQLADVTLPGGQLSLDEDEDHTYLTLDAAGRWVGRVRCQVKATLNTPPGTDLAALVVAVVRGGMAEPLIDWLKDHAPPEFVAVLDLADREAA